MELKICSKCDVEQKIINFGFTKRDVDHIKPISKFDKNEEIKVVNSLSNLQPLWAYENLKKGNKYE